MNSKFHSPFFFGGEHIKLTIAEPECVHLLPFPSIKGDISFGQCGNSFAGHFRRVLDLWPPNNNVPAPIQLELGECDGKFFLICCRPSNQILYNRSTDIFVYR